MTTSRDLAPLPDGLDRPPVHVATARLGHAPTVDGMLWLAFHRAVTTQPADLRRWLDRQHRAAAGQGRAELIELGRAVATLLETPRCDLTGHDIRVMRTALHRIRVLRDEVAHRDPEDVEDLRWQLRALGHDPRRAER